MLRFPRTFFLIVLLAVVAFRAEGQTTYVSRKSWLGDLKLSITLPKGWFESTRSHPREWADKGFLVELKRRRSKGNDSSGEVAFTLGKFPEGRLQRNGLLPGMHSDQELTKEGIRLIREFAIASGQKGVVTVFDSNRDQRNPARTPPISDFSFTLVRPIKGNQTCFIVTIGYRRAYSDALLKDTLAILSTIRIERSFKSLERRARSRTAKIVYLPDDPVKKKRTWRNSPIAYDGLGQVYANGREANADADLQISGHDLDYPAWSPDRYDLAASTGVPDADPGDEVPRAEGINPEEAGIYIISANGLEKSRLTYRSDESPAWSPDDKRLAFERWLKSDKGRRSKICSIDLHTEKVTDLTDGQYDDRQPCWRPDGRSLLFSSNRSGTFKVYSVDLKTKKVTLLPGQPSGHCIYPQWSPDGKKVIVICVRNPRYDYPARAAVLEPKGGPTRMIKLPNLLMDRVVWSPDGQRIAYMAAVTERSWEIRIAKPNGSGSRRVLPRHGRGMKDGWHLAW